MKKLVIVLAGAIVPLGLAVACTPPGHPAPLACSAVAGPAVQGGTETIAVHSAAGARILASAAYHKSTPQVVGLTNRLGLGRVALPVPDVGYRVKVTVTTLKGAQRGSCVAYFTPTKPVGRSSPPPPPPPSPPGPVTVSCADLNFPAIPDLQPSGEPFPGHSYDIQATDTSCQVAWDIATGANQEYRNKYALELNPKPTSRDGFTCAESVTFGEGGIAQGVNVCTNVGAPNAKVTFTWGLFTVLGCPASNKFINLQEANTDCAFAEDVANVVTASPMGYQADGFNCFRGGTVQNGFQYYGCYTPDYLSYIGFSAIGQP